MPLKPPPDGDPYELSRFTEAQEGLYPEALGELRAGRKRTHWMWFVFPQFDGLGVSPISHRYAIRSLEEARAYLAHPLLGSRLTECSKTLLDLPGVAAPDVFPYPDDLKLKSSMTLFELAAPAGSVFGSVLDKFFRGERDTRTLQLVERRSRRSSS